MDFKKIRGICAYILANGGLHRLYEAYVMSPHGNFPPAIVMVIIVAII